MSARDGAPRSHATGVGWAAAGAGLFALASSAYAPSSPAENALRVFSAAILLSAIGVVLRREPARKALLALLALGNVWNLAAVARETARWWRDPQARAGLSIAAVVALAVLALSVWAARLLTAPAARAEFR
ncbi:MAG: hypothetical protein KGM24_14225 [Elusimicrobia bacterium]|nr:hypothetical protein [Elusimicrobiota bacterium]